MVGLSEKETEAFAEFDAAAKGGKSGPQANGHDTSAGGADAPGNKTDPRPDLECAQLPNLGCAKIPPRRWAYGRFLLFRQCACLAAVDGGGKGAIAVGIALAHDNR